MLFDQIYKDYINARKERNRQKADFLGYLRSQLANYAKDNKKDKLDDPEVIKILKKQQKKLKEAWDSVSSSGRDDIRKNLEIESKIIAGYLPQPLSQDEINRVIEKIIARNQASSRAEMGKVMKEILAEIGTKADPQYISKVVKEKLS